MGGIGRSRQSQPLQPRENLAALQKVYGNQAVLRMKGRSPTAIPLQGGVLQRKCACGSSAGSSGSCAECQSKQEGILQTKLQISEPGDRYEQEADRIADQVMKMPEPTIQRQIEPEEEEEEMVQRKAISPSISPLIQRRGAPNQAETSEVPPIVNEVLHSSGQPLESEIRAFMEPRFGHDFSSVRIHHDEQAAESARAIHAHAYTVGRDVVFGPGQYKPQTESGRRLLGHELTHVLQQCMPLTQPVAGMEAPEAQVRLSQGSDSEAQIFRDSDGEATDDEIASQLIFAEIGPKSMSDILKRLDAADKEELSKLRANSALAKPYGRERLELAMKVVWYAKFERAVLAEWRPLLQADIDRIVPDTTHHDQHEELTHFLNQSRLQAVSAAAPAPVAKRGVSKGATAAPSEESMAAWEESKRTKWKKWLDSRDAKVQTFGAADYEDYVANMLVSGGSVFGKTIPASNPVHPLFLERLEAASVKARAAIGSDDLGIRNISGQDNRPGNHAWGLAVDIDADSNPYILNEAGEKVIDAAVAQVYQRIAKALLGRDSIITPPTPGTGKKDPGKQSGLEGASYMTLAEENDAMAAYFSVLPDPTPTEAPAAAKGKKVAAPPPALPVARKMSSVTIDPAKIAALDKVQVQADYDLLIGKTKQKGMSGDLPFAGAGSGRWRDPKRGFLSIRKEVAEALKGEGLRWGATDFPGASGDVMHFDDNNRHGDYVTYGKSHPTEKGKPKKEKGG